MRGAAPVLTTAPRYLGRRRWRLDREGSRGCSRCRTSSGRTAPPGPLPIPIPPCLPTMSLTIFFCRATCALPPSEPMKHRQTSSRFQPRRSSTFIRPLLINDEIETPLDFFLVAKENAVPLASETQVTDGWPSPVEIWCMAASPAFQEGKRYAKITRTLGIRCTCTVTSVITPPPSGTTQA